MQERDIKWNVSIISKLSIEEGHLDGYKKDQQTIGKERKLTEFLSFSIDQSAMVSILSIMFQLGLTPRQAHNSSLVIKKKPDLLTMTVL